MVIGMLELKIIQTIFMVVWFNILMFENIRDLENVYCMKLCTCPCYSLIAPNLCMTLENHQRQYGIWFAIP
jgi:hypothetical protein